MQNLSKRAMLAFLAAMALHAAVHAQPMPVDPEQEKQAVQIAENFLKLADEKGMGEARKLIGNPALNGDQLGSSLHAKDSGDAFTARDQMAPMSRRKLVSTKPPRQRPKVFQNSGAGNGPPPGPAWAFRFVSEGARAGSLLTSGGQVFEGKYCVEEIVVRFDQGREPYVASYHPLPTPHYR